MSSSKYDHISCLDEWLELQGWSLGLSDEEQDRIEARMASEMADVRAALWNRHYASLDPDLQRQLDDGTHPWGNWDRRDEAAPYLEELRQALREVDFVESVELGYYHGHSVVFTVSLARPMHWRDYRSTVPEFFEGFMVFVAQPEPAQPESS